MGSPTILDAINSAPVIDDGIRIRCHSHFVASEGVEQWVAKFLDVCEDLCICLHRGSRGDFLADQGWRYVFGSKDGPQPLEYGNQDFDIGRVRQVVAIDERSISHT